MCLCNWGIFVLLWLCADVHNIEILFTVNSTVHVQNICRASFGHLFNRSSISGKTWSIQLLWTTLTKFHSLPLWKPRTATFVIVATNIHKMQQNQSEEQWKRVMFLFVFWKLMYGNVYRNIAFKYNRKMNWLFVKFSVTRSLTAHHIHLWISYMSFHRKPLISRFCGKYGIPFKMSKMMLKW